MELMGGRRDGRLGRNCPATCASTGLEEFVWMAGTTVALALVGLSAPFPVSSAPASLAFRGSHVD